jgi:uncharacterized protein (DUF1501 family)
MRTVTRRDLLRYLGIAGGAAAAGIPLACSDQRSVRLDSGTSTSRFTLDGSPGSTMLEAAASSGATATASGDVSQRLLVVIEMAGGNDGLSTVVPAGMGRYRDLRTATAIAEDQLVWLDDTFAVPTQLSSVADRLAIVHGVGSDQPNGSHFEMLQRWWTGDPIGNRTPDTGFLGRLCDAVGDPASAAVGVSFGAANSVALRSNKVTTLNVPDLSMADLVYGADPDQDWVRWVFQEAVTAMAIESAGDTDMLLAARKSTRDTISFVDRIGGLNGDERNEAYPGTTLGDRLELTSRLIAAESGIRVFHVPMDSDFDTHEDHVGRHAGLMDQYASALSVFLDDLGARGLLDRVLVASTSEFGRRVPDNGSGGLDHGAASSMLLAGAINPGMYGELPSLDDLDDGDNLRATVSLDSYYATLSGWLGVPASDVVADAEIISGMW